MISSHCEGEYPYYSSLHMCGMNPGSGHLTNLQGVKRIQNPGYLIKNAQTLTKLKEGL